MDLSFLRRIPRLPAILLLCLIAYGAGSRRTGFTGKDELRYAQIAKEMDSLRGFFLLHYQGEVYPDKPPLYFWMARASYCLTGGVSPLGARLPLILCTLLTVALTYDIGRRFFGERPAVLAALFHGLCFRVLWSAHWTKLDPPLVAFTTLAFWFWVREMPSHEMGERPTLGSVMGFWCAMGLAFLVKGPLGLVIPLGTLLVCFAARRKWRGAIGWSTILGILAFLIALSVWIVPGLHFGGWKDYFRIIWDQEIVGRTTQPWRHTKAGVVNWAYYLAHILEFLPGALFLPAAFAIAWRRRAEKSAERNAVLFLLSWFWFIFIFFTLMKSKRAQYILPLYPAAGLLAGWAADRLLRGDPQARKWTLIPLRILGILCIAAGIVVQFDISALKKEFQVPVPLAGKIAALAVAVPVGVMILRLVRRERWTGAVGWAIAATPSLFLVALLLYFPVGYQDASYKDIARFTDALTEKGDVVYTHDAPNPYLNIYGHYLLRRFQGSEHLAGLGPDFDSFSEEFPKLTIVAALPEPTLIFVTKRKFEEFRRACPDSVLYVVREFDAPRFTDEGGVCLVSNRPGNP
jgi:4-amino-4-deoxy-L-arabinose transferase-like glycosyltransferase